MCVVAAVAIATACDNSALTDANKNPNAPTSVSAELLFPNAAIASVRQVRSAMEITPSAFAHWPQYLAEYQYPEISYYQFRPTTADGWWNAWYTGPLEDLAKALDKATAANRPNQIAPVLVMRAFDYSIMTGIWGDIPFTQANRGDASNITPVYDTQKLIYDSLITNLEDANTKLGGPGIGFGDQDPVYAGDAAQWKKLANSLRARLGMNLSKVDANRAKAVVAAAVAAGGFESNDDNAQINWPGDNINDNPWYDNQAPPAGNGTRDDARFSVTFVDTLKHLNDPRLQVFARPVQDSSCGTVTSCAPVASGGYRGMPNGLFANDAGGWGTKASRLSLQISAATQPSYIMTYAEFCFIKAEAAEKGWISGSAAQFYTDGVTASMKQWGVSDAAIATYLAQSRIAYAGGTAGLAQIGVQKWIALFTQGFEAWSEWRRTGYPNLVPAVNARTPDGLLPRRVIYPQTEQSFNNTNLQKAIGAQGGSDALNKKLWIDP